MKSWTRHLQEAGCVITLKVKRQYKNQLQIVAIVLLITIIAGHRYRRIQSKYLQIIATYIIPINTASIFLNLDGLTFSVQYFYQTVVVFISNRS